MTLLSKLFKKQNEIIKNQNDHFLVLTQATNYRGFKKIGLVSYGHKLSVDGLTTLHSQDLTGKEIVIDKFIYGNKNVGYAVFVNGFQVGAIFPDTSAASKSALDALQNKKITAAHVRIDSINKIDQVTYAALLFVKVED